jgi:hypothetical protein
LKALPTRHHLTSEYCQTFISLIYQQVRQHQAHTVRAMTMMETTSSSSSLSSLLSLTRTNTSTVIIKEEEEETW